MSDGIRLAKLGRINLLRAHGRRPAAPARRCMRRLIREGWLRHADLKMLGIAFVSPLVLWRQLHAINADLPMIRESARVRPPARRSVPARRRRASAGAAPPRRARLEAITPPRPVAASCSLRGSSPCLVVSCLMFSSPLLATAVRAAEADADTAAQAGRHRRSRATTAVEQPITRFIRVSGTLTAAGRCRGRRRGRRPRRRHAGRARQPRRRQRRADPDCGDRSRGAGARSAGQRRADRGPARDRRRRAVRRRTRARSRQRQRGAASWRSNDFERAQTLLRAASCCRSRTSISAARRPKRPSVSTTSRATARRSSTSR